MMNSVNISIHITYRRERHVIANDVPSDREFVVGIKQDVHIALKQVTVQSDD